MNDSGLIHVGGHRVEDLPRGDSHEYCCVDCAGHADDLDAYREDYCDKAGDMTAFDEDPAAYTLEQVRALFEIRDVDEEVVPREDLEETPTDIPENAVAYVMTTDEMLRLNTENCAIPTYSDVDNRGKHQDFWVLELQEPLTEDYTDYVGEGS